ncbi:hypothetical protein EIN_174430 [Entamoeba invadens IP1]|uniref:Uncharacterized protein n=1 Tax=Entamoeba invadens IP1 TaxID=370355 RepID=A0A0A1U1G6_ENTIV|nr:hypothetical protein EIN_174430 [Entamoeba invadens IP1]ELP84748.1 hypothetical protein EIN_174430 [Entamoeba invadens IP1]|eukprot:XP_004184094.1 hypothetical protein EIN_174430 [Entamoeba invadens IP1]
MSSAPSNSTKENIQTRQSRDKKTKEVAQLSFLTWILNEQFSFTFQRPKKRSTVNFCFPDLLEIDFGKDKMDMTKFLNERVEEDFTQFCKSMTVKQASRKVDHLKRVYINNYLTDLAVHSGVAIQSKSTKKDLEQMERFVEIQFRGETFGQNSIIEAGVEINVHLMEFLGENTIVNIPKGQLFNSFSL